MNELKNFIGKKVLIFVKGSDKTFTYKGALKSVEDTFAIIDDFKTGSTAIPIINILSISEVGDGE
jgi:small nuclear ribonucleoprotein (snRNP)-like protein